MAAHAVDAVGREHMEVGSAPSALSASDCGAAVPWVTYTGGPLGQFAYNHGCVQIGDGTYVYGATQLIRPGPLGFVYIRGNGAATVLKGDPSMHCPENPPDKSCFRRLLRVDQSNVRLENFKIDGDAWLSNGTMRAGLACGITVHNDQVPDPTPTADVVVENVIFRNLVCCGVQLGGNGNEVKGGNFAYIGGYCPDSNNFQWFGVGAGVYAAAGGGLASWNIKIRDNAFQNLQGTPIDVARVTFGAITGNSIKNTHGLSGIHLYADKYFNILDNEIDNAGGVFNQAAWDTHPYCFEAMDNEEVAIRVCSDSKQQMTTDMLIDGNVIKNSDYGIQLIGEDGYEPDASTVENNDLWNNPSGRRCRDDRAPEENTWANSSCNVGYF